MKIALAFVFALALLAAIAANAPIALGSSMTCNTTTCAQLGKACVSSKVQNASTCAAGLWCINSTCQTDNIGDPCVAGNSHHMCYTPEYGVPVACVNSVCTYQYYPGDSCSGNSDCISSNCVNKICAGVSSGNPCSNGMCSPGFYCSHNKCTQMLALNHTCTPTSAIYPALDGPCLTGSVCGHDGVCVTAFTVASGSKCALDEECDTGLICNSNQTCASPVAAKLTTCSANTDCTSVGSGSTCVCGDGGSSYCSEADNVNYDYGVEALDNLVACLAKFNCSSLGIATDSPNSCSYINCRSDFKSYNGYDCSNTKKVVGNCYYNPNCGGFPVWAIVVIVIVIIVVVIALAVIVFMVMRRRREYSSI